MNGLVKDNNSFQNVPTISKSSWEGLITFSTTRATLFAMTLVKILKLTLRRQIGLNCWICVASFCSGIHLISPKLRLYRFRSPLWNSLKRAIRSPLINNFLKYFIELVREAIRSWRLVMLKNCFFHIFFYDVCGDNIIFYFRNLQNVPSLISSIMEKLLHSRAPKRPL